MTSRSSWNGITSRQPDAPGRMRPALLSYGGASSVNSAKRLKVGRRLATRLPPGPLLADRGGEPQPQDGVERVVRGPQHRAEESIQVLWTQARGR